MRCLWIWLVAVSALAGCSTENMNAFAEGMQRGREMFPAPKQTYCTKADDQIFCQTY